MEHVSQAVLFLEDAGDLGQALNTDVDEMSMDEQVLDPAALHVVLTWVFLSIQICVLRAHQYCSILECVHPWAMHSMLTRWCFDN